MTVIEVMHTADGPRYRAWSTVSDSYLDDEMRRDAALAFLLRHGHDAESAAKVLDEAARVDSWAEALAD